MSRNFELLHQLNGSPQSEVYPNMPPIPPPHETVGEKARLIPLERTADLATARELEEERLVHRLSLTPSLARELWCSQRWMPAAERHVSVRVPENCSPVRPRVRVVSANQTCDIPLCTKRSELKIRQGSWMHYWRRALSKVTRGRWTRKGFG